MSWVAAAVGVVSAGVKIYSGIKQKNAAKKQLAELQGKEIPGALLDNQRLATQMAGQGMPSEQYAQAQKNIDRQNNLAIMRAANRRAGIGLISTIQQNTNDANSNLDARNALMRLQNERTLLGVNSQVAGYQNQKYQGDYNYARSLQGAGNQNINSGIDEGIAGIGSGVSGYMSKRRGGGYFGGGSNNAGWGQYITAQ